MEEISRSAKAMEPFGVGVKRAQEDLRDIQHQLKEAVSLRYHAPFDDPEFNVQSFKHPNELEMDRLRALSGKRMDRKRVR